MALRDTPGFPSRGPRPRWLKARYLLPGLALAIALVLVLSSVLTGGLSSSDRRACDAGLRTETALDKAARAGTPERRSQYRAQAELAWTTVTSAARNGSERLQIMSKTWLGNDSPILDGDAEQLLEWCRENGWDG